MPILPIDASITLMASPAGSQFHSGEEVLVKNILMRKWRRCAIIPFGTYHAEVPSTVLNESGTVDGHALDLLPEMMEKSAPETISLLR